MFFHSIQQHGVDGQYQYLNSLIERLRVRRGEAAGWAVRGGIVMQMTNYNCEFKFYVVVILNDLSKNELVR